MKDKIADIINQYPAPILKIKASPVRPLSQDVTSSLTKPDSTPVNTLWEKEICQFITDLKAAAKALSYNCLGLAANQLWPTDTAYPAVFVMRWPTNSYKDWIWQEVINPKIAPSGKQIKQKEGCLSLITHTVSSKIIKRRSNVTLTYQTLNNDIPQTTKFYGHLGPYAQIVQHEYAHLLGQLCIE